jgi:hypothetical protein
LDLKKDGAFSYRGEEAYSGWDKFQYRINDGRKTSNCATVSLWFGHKDPLARWELNEATGSTAVDSGSGQHSGALTNMGEDSRVTDGGLACLRFDGQDDYVSVPPLNLNSNMVTITAWVKRDGVQPIFAGIVISSDGDTLAGLGLGSTPGWQPNHEIGYFWNGASWNWHSELILPDAKWCFVALVVSQDRASVYLGQDGVLKSATNAGKHNPEEFNGVTRIGNNAQKDQRFFKGLIRDVRIYDRPLQENELKSLAQADPK